MITDHDFGRAYLTDAWATRFLRDVFQHFVVVFVGFSHDDPIMNYLGMGLPSSTRRFILTDKAEDPRWNRLGITPIAYPSDNSHAAVAHALAEWAKRASMGRLEHRARIHDIVLGGPPKNPVEADYLSQMLEDPDGAKAFAERASGADWLDWLEQKDVFAANFRPDFIPDFEGRIAEASLILAHWYCERFVANPGEQPAALNLVERAGQQFSRQLFNAASWATRQLSEQDPDAARRWTVLLTTSIPGHSAPRPLSSFLSTHGSGNAHANRIALRQGLRPSLKLRPDYWVGLLDDDSRPDRIPRVELGWPIDEHTADKYWKALTTNDALDLRLCLILEDSLLNAYELLTAWTSDEKNFDSLSFRRSAIEPHAQDRLREVVDVVINGLRECGEVLVQTDFGLIERWWQLGYPLFRRLAVHLIGHSSEVDPTRTTRWIIDRDLVFDHLTKHEVYVALQNAVPFTSADVKRALLERINLGPNLEDDVFEPRHSDYMKYNILSWITTADPKWAEARAAFDALREANADFEPRDHPDLGHWLESGVWGGTPPATHDDFVQMIRTDGVDQALDWLLTQDYSERTFEAPTWDDALGLVRTLADTEPCLGLEVFHSSILASDDRGLSVQFALTHGWAKADLGECALAVVDGVATLVSDGDAADAIAFFLDEQVRGHADDLDTEIAGRLRGLATSVWNTHSLSFNHPADVDPISLAVNSWPGRLANYWIGEIGRSWRSDPDGWTGLTEEQRPSVLSLLQGPAAAVHATRPALAGQTYFLFAADPGFTVDFIFPLFSTAGPAIQAWGPYLYHPRWNNRFLERGFLELLIDAIAIIDELGGLGLEHQYWDLLVSVLAYSDLDPEKRTDILDRLIIDHDGLHIVRLIEHLSYLVDRVEPEEAAQLWEAWIGAYMQRRFDGEPRRSSEAELEAWADIVPTLGDQIPAGAAMVLSRDIGFGSKFDWPEARAASIKSYAQVLGGYLCHRLRNSPALDHMVAYNVREACQEVLGHLEGDAEMALKQCAAERGISLGS